MSGVTEHCYGIGLQIYHTNWRCCSLDYVSELCFDKFSLSSSSLHK